MALTSKQKASSVAALCAAAALACLPLTKQSEGEKLKPYRDPANIVTWCYGETQGFAKPSYTDAECAQLLQTRLAKRYAPIVAACIPQLADKDRIRMFGAYLDAQYNTGAVCGSPMAGAVRAGKLRSSCELFTGWYVTARYRGKPEPALAMIAHGWHWDGKYWRKILPGLVARRVREAALCRTDLKTGDV